MKHIPVLTTLTALLALWTIMLGAFIPSEVEGAVPQLISFQGVLRDGSGNPVANGSYSATFRIYDAASAGNVLWSESTTVTTSGGVFFVLLGSLNPVPDTVFNDPNRWLGTSVSPDPEMTPRQRLASVGYALRTEQWTSAAQDLFRLNGDVGVGTSLLGGAKLDVLIFGSDPVSVKGIRSQVENSSSGEAIGGYFVTSTAGTGNHYGVYAQGNGSSSYGVYGSGGNYGVYGTGSSYGVYGIGGTGGTGVYGVGSGAGGVAVHAASNGDVGVLSYTSSSSASSIIGIYSDASNGSTGSTYGGYFTGNSTGGLSYGVYGSAGIGGQFTGNGPGSRGVEAYGTIYGVLGTSNTIGGQFEGLSGGSYGVNAIGVSRGVNALGDDYGVVGTASINGGAGVYGYNDGNILTYGVYSSGDARVTRNLTVDGFIYKNGGGFKIDHPTDPANKYLYHSFVESPDMKNIYDGVVALNAKGEAAIRLPHWFDAVNKDFRYQLTAIGAPGPNLYVAQKVSNNQFKIAGGTAGMEVSWQVTGIRKDVYAEAHRIPVEEVKSGKERGKYLHPEEYGAPASLGMHYEEEQKLAAEHKKMEEERAKMEADRKLQEEQRAKMEQERAKRIDD